MAGTRLPLALLELELRLLQACLGDGTVHLLEQGLLRSVQEPLVGLQQDQVGVARGLVYLVFHGFV